MSRVVVHLDCDCFYAQVELLRLGLPPETPLCVVQWGSALAVSYAARPFGIKRGDRVADIDRKSAGAVTVVSVETIGSEGDEAAAAAPPDVPPGAAPGAAPDATAPDATAPDATAPDDGALPTDARNTEKVSLARYRNASAAVFDVIASMLPPSVAFERASIDEVFLDISAEVDTRVRRRRRRAAGLAALDTAPDLPADTLLMDGGARDAGAAGDRFLYEGALFAAELRGAVLAQSGYTMSAGVAQNKMLAKYASACNKPNKQTVMLPAAVESLLARVPITAFRGCGGKIGNTVAELGFATAAVRGRVCCGAPERARPSLTLTAATLTPSLVCLPAGGAGRDDARRAAGGGRYATRHLHLGRVSRPGRLTGDPAA
jgi:DNA polymerase eta